MLTDGAIVQHARGEDTAEDGAIIRRAREASTAEDGLRPQQVQPAEENDGLSALVQGGLGQQPKSGHLFVFFSRRRDFVRILFWDANGYCTVSKRLEAGRFRVPLPVEGQAAVHLEVRQLSELLSLVEASRQVRRREVH